MVIDVLFHHRWSAKAVPIAADTVMPVAVVMVVAPSPIPAVVMCGLIHVAGLKISLACQSPRLRVNARSVQHVQPV